jgi:hypothetical protein
MTATNQPPAVDPSDEASRVLDAAADRIERQGLWQSADDVPHRPATECVAIAIGRAADVLRLPPDPAWQRFRKHVGGEGALQWNDDPVRTQAQVVAALRAAARSR